MAGRVGFERASPAAGAASSSLGRDCGAERRCSPDTAQLGQRKLTKKSGTLPQKSADARGFRFPVDSAAPESRQP